MECCGVFHSRSRWKFLLHLLSRWLPLFIPSYLHPCLVWPTTFRNILVLLYFCTVNHIGCQVTLMWMFNENITQYSLEIVSLVQPGAINKREICNACALLWKWELFQQHIFNMRSKLVNCICLIFSIFPSTLVVDVWCSLVKVRDNRSKYWAVVWVNNYCMTNGKCGQLGKVQPYTSGTCVLSTI